MYLVVTVICSLFCCASLLAGGQSAIAVFMDFQSEPSAATVSEMEREVAAIMKPSGWQFDWRRIEEVRAGESFEDLVVVKFKGSCEAESAPVYNELDPNSKPQPLAHTQVADGHVLPFSDVLCDTIRDYIAPAATAGDSQKRDRLLGRAMGRVLAHEMYHMFVKTTEHGEDGVARAFHTRKDLTAREFHFTARETLKLKEILEEREREWKRLFLAGEGRFPATAAMNR
jgi:hypothetical protein